MRDPAEIIADQLAPGAEGPEQHAFARAAAGMTIEALKQEGWDIVPRPTDPGPWTAGVDDSAYPPMIDNMHYVLDHLSHKTTVPDLIKLARMSAGLDQRTRLGYFVQCALLNNVADRLEVICASLPNADPAVVDHVHWYMSWGYFNGKIRDAWAVFRRRAIALYI